jgi:hypothetical protein
MARTLLAAEETCEHVRDRAAVALLEVPGELAREPDVVRALAESRVVAVAVERLTAGAIPIRPALP